MKSKFISQSIIYLLPLLIQLANAMGTEVPAFYIGTFSHNLDRKSISQITPPGFT